MTSRLACLTMTSRLECSPFTSESVAPARNCRQTLCAHTYVSCSDRYITLSVFYLPLRSMHPCTKTSLRNPLCCTRLQQRCCALRLSSALLRDILHARLTCVLHAVLAQCMLLTVIECVPCAGLSFGTFVWKWPPGVAKQIMITLSRRSLCQRAGAPLRLHCAILSLWSVIQANLRRSGTGLATHTAPAWIIQPLN